MWWQRHQTCDRIHLGRRSDSSRGFQTERMFQNQHRRGCARLCRCRHSGGGYMCLSNREWSRESSRNVDWSDWKLGHSVSKFNWRESSKRWNVDINISVPSDVIWPREIVYSRAILFRTSYHITHCWQASEGQSWLHTTPLASQSFRPATNWPNRTRNWNREKYSIRIRQCWKHYWNNTDSTVSRQLLPEIGSVIWFHISVIRKEKTISAFHFSFDDLRETIEKQSRCSKIIITSGGVSMGDKDFLKNVLEHLGYETHFGRVNMKPGWVNNNRRCYALSHSGFGGFFFLLQQTNDICYQQIEQCGLWLTGQSCVSVRYI